MSKCKTFKVEKQKKDLLIEVNIEHQRKPKKLQVEAKELLPKSAPTVELQELKASKKLIFGIAKQQEIDITSEDNTVEITKEEDENIEFDLSVEVKLNSANTALTITEDSPNDFTLTAVETAISSSDGSVTVNKTGVNEFNLQVEETAISSANSALAVTKNEKNDFILTAKETAISSSDGSVSVNKTDVNEFDLKAKSSGGATISITSPDGTVLVGGNSTSGFTLSVQDYGDTFASLQSKINSLETTINSMKSTINQQTDTINVLNESVEYILQNCCNDGGGAGNNDLDAERSLMDMYEVIRVLANELNCEELGPLLTWQMIRDLRYYCPEFNDFIEQQQPGFWELTAVNWKYESVSELHQASAQFNTLRALPVYQYIINTLRAKGVDIDRITNEYEMICVYYYGSYIDFAQAMGGGAGGSYSAKLKELAAMICSSFSL